MMGVFLLKPYEFLPYNIYLCTYFLLVWVGAWYCRRISVWGGETQLVFHDVSKCSKPERPERAPNASPNILENRFSPSRSYHGTFDLLCLKCLTYSILLRQKHFKSLESRQAYLRSIDSTLASPEELQRQLGGRLPVIHFSHPGLMQATIETLLCFPIEALRAVFRSGIVFAFPHLFIVPATLVCSFSMNFNLIYSFPHRCI